MKKAKQKNELDWGRRTEQCGEQHEDSMKRNCQKQQGQLSCQPGFSGGERLTSESKLPDWNK